MKKYHKRRRIGLPRGLLRHVTLLLLKEQDMSGSELMEEVNEYTGWQPSPGSMYPLLERLQEEGLIEPCTDRRPTFKPFKITEKGRKVIEQHTNHIGQFKKRMGSMLKIYWLLMKQMPEKTYQRYYGLVEQLEKTYSLLKEEEDLERLHAIIDNATKQLEELVEK